MPKKKTNVGVLLKGDPRRNNRGITLIALIITIIVMLILVSVAVRSAINSGLFGHTKNAVGKWAEAEKQEGEIDINGLIDEHVPTTEEGTKIYAALYNDGTDITLVFKNIPDFEKANLVKIYTNEKGEPLDINELDLYYYWASMGERQKEKSQYTVCSNWTTTDLRNSNNAKFILAVDSSMPHTNIPWLFEWPGITCVDFRTKIIPNNTNNWFNGFNDLVKIKNIKNLDTSKVTNMESMFSGCESLTNLDLSSFNTSKVTSMSSMFHNCSNLTNLDVSSFNTSNVTSMWSMFDGCESLTNLDLSSFNTSNVTDMPYMFYDCSSLTNLDISNFNTSNVTNMYSMFSGCSSLTNLDISSFNTSNVTNMYFMFSGCSNLTKIFVGSGWLTSGADTGKMFTGCGTSEVTTK